MTIFDQLGDLLFTKKKKCLNNITDEGDYVPFMINRWVSMCSADHCEVINNTVNWLHPILETKTDHYNLLHTVLPRTRWKRINYIKKKKPEESQEQDDIEALARALELSSREVKYLTQQDEQARRH